jgi:hypothetical protein
MFDTAYMVDEILFLVAMDWTYEVLILMLLRPMLFIGTIAICSWDTCTINMLAMTYTSNWKKQKAI